MFHLHIYSYELSPLPMPTQPRPKYSSIHLTNVHHIYIHRIGEGAAQSVGGHHGDVVVDPDGRVVLVKEAGVLSSCLVVGTLMHCVRAAGEAQSKNQHKKGLTLLQRKKQTSRQLLSLKFFVCIIDILFPTVSVSCFMLSSPVYLVTVRNSHKIRLSYCRLASSQMMSLSLSLWLMLVCQRRWSHSLLFAIVQGIGGGQAPIRAWFPPASEGLFFGRTTSGQCGLLWEAVT